MHNVDYKAPEKASVTGRQLGGVHNFQRCRASPPSRPLCTTPCLVPAMQNVKLVFDSAIKVVLSPPKQEKGKKKSSGKCSIV